MILSAKGGRTKMGRTNVWIAREKGVGGIGRLGSTHTPAETTYKIDN